MAALVSRLRTHVGESADEDEVVVAALNYMSSGGALRAHHHRDAVVHAAGANALCDALDRHAYRSEAILRQGTQALSSIFQIMSSEKALAAGAIKALGAAVTSPLLDDCSDTAVLACSAIKSVVDAPSESRDSSAASDAARDAFVDSQVLKGLVGVFRGAAKSSSAWKSAKEALAAIAKGSAKRQAAVAYAGGAAALQGESKASMPVPGSAYTPRPSQVDIDKKKKGGSSRAPTEVCRMTTKPAFL